LFVVLFRGMGLVVGMEGMLLVRLLVLRVLLLLR
jgi:hypothetical protein